MAKVWTVYVCWDVEARVWYVSDSDVPGLNAEAATLDEMQNELAALVPELLVLNGIIKPKGKDRGQVPWNLVSRHNETIRSAC